jgi:tRNA modification GTPase
MTPPRETIAAVLTPSGRGAVATVRVEGPASSAAVAEYFRPATSRNLRSAAIGKILFGRWRTGQGEELVACRRGESVWEIHCHGGAAASRAVLDDLVAVGCSEVSWPNWVERHEDPIRAAALGELALARTERTANILLAQYHGSLGRAINSVAALIAEEEYDAATGKLEVLIGRAVLGQRLTRPFRVVLAGPANVGKSSLINALLGYQRAIVFDQPGTTRDVVTGETALDGWPVTLSDTAGLRAAQSTAEAAGVARSAEQLAEADLIVLVFDQTQAWSDEIDLLWRQWPDALRIDNKDDLLPASGSRPPGLKTSAATGAGVADLCREIAARLVPDAPPSGAAMPFTDAIADAIADAQNALRSHEPNKALALLHALIPPSAC